MWISFLTFSLFLSCMYNLHCTLGWSRFGTFFKNNNWNYCSGGKWYTILCWIQNSFPFFCKLPHFGSIPFWNSEKSKGGPFGEKKYEKNRFSCLIPQKNHLEKCWLEVKSVFKNINFWGMKNLGDEVELTFLPLMPPKMIWLQTLYVLVFHWWGVEFHPIKYSIILLT